MFKPASFQRLLLFNISAVSLMYAVTFTVILAAKGLCCLTKSVIIVLYKGAKFQLSAFNCNLKCVTIDED